MNFLRVFSALMILGFVTLYSFLLAAAQTNTDYEVWIADQIGDQITVFDGKSLEPLSTIAIDNDGKPASSKPHMVSFSPDFRYAYVANVGSPKDTNNLVVVRAQDRKLMATLPAGPSAHAAVASPDGRRIWVSNIGGNNLTEVVFDPAAESWSLSRTLPAHGVRPICQMFSADGSKVYLTNGGNKEAMGNLVVMEVKSGALVQRVDDFGRDACGLARSNSGVRVFANVGFNADNPLLINDWVYTYNALTDRQMRKAQVGKDAHGLALSPDGMRLWVVNRQSGTVSVLNANTLTPIATYTVGDKPDLVALSPDGKRVFVSLRGQAVTGDAHALSGNEPGLVVLDAATGQRVKHIPLSGDPHGLAVRPR